MASPEGKGSLPHYYNLHKGSWVISTFSALCLFMAFWSWILPGSFRVGPGDDAHARRLTSFGAFAPASPSDIFLQFRHHLSVRVMHNFTAGLWSLCGLHNLQPWVSDFSPAWHRRLGYFFLACSSSLAFSYWLMEFYGLTHSPHGGTYPLFPMSIWFLYTAVMSAQTARSRQFQKHRAWVLRHLAAGLWVVMQRVLVGLFSTGWGIVTRGRTGRAEEDKVRVFMVAAYLGMVLSLGMTEYEARRPTLKASKE